VANRALGLGPFDAWTSLFAQTRFAIDCHTVITLRMMRMAGGGEVAVREAVRMVTEKMETFASAQMAAVAAMPRHGLQGAATAAEQHYRRTVSRNRRRLSGG
jgi:hypothetical protein